MARGVCRGADPTLFDYDSSVNEKDVVELYCASCPVRYLCRDYAIDNQFAGVWGFTTTARNHLARWLGKPIAL